jgi:thiamine pyrophosphate-dependent acetolactate synthase large subunit-like protein
MDKTKKDKKGKTLSRRDFVKTAAIGAGVAAAAVTAGKPSIAQAQAGLEIKTPEDWKISRAAPLPKIDYPMNGAAVFAKVCKDEGLGAILCAPGNYTIVHALVDAGIPAYGGRDEGAMASAADGFVRASGVVAACSGTEGPGFALMIEAMASANAARSPMLLLASNMRMGREDTEAGIQLMYQQPMTEGIKKYGKRIIVAPRIAEYAGYAFRQLKSGRPGPVHLDFPSEIAGAKFKSAKELERYVGKAKYRTECKAYPDKVGVQAAVDLLKKAKRPLIWADIGVHYHQGVEALKSFAEKTQIPVATSGPARAVFPDEGHSLSASTAQDSWKSADVIMIVGKYCLPLPYEVPFSPDAKYIRIDPSAEDIGRNFAIDVGIVSDEKAALEALYNAAPSMKHDSWIAEVAAARNTFDAKLDSYYKQGLKYTDRVHPAVIGKQLNDFLYHGNIPRDQTCAGTGGYGINFYSVHYLRAYRPGQIYIPAFQFATIANSVGMGLGVAAAVQTGTGYQAGYQGAPVVTISSDAGFGQQMIEIETQMLYKLPVIHIVYNNNAWGTWRGVHGQPSGHLHLMQENVRYDKMAEGCGAHAEYITKPEDFRPALERCYKISATESVPTCINCQGRKEFWDKAKYPPGFLGLVHNVGIGSVFH